MLLQLQCHREGFYFNANLKRKGLLYLLNKCAFILQHQPQPPLHLLNSQCSIRHAHVGLLFRLFPAWVVGTFPPVPTSVVCVELLHSPIPLKVTWIPSACALIFSVCPHEHVKELFFLSFGTEVGGSPTFWVFDLRAWWPC